MLEKMNSTETAYNSIRHSILNGVYPAGMRLKEAKLSIVLEVSRTPIREALRRLMSEGLVEFETNHGARVTSFSEKDLEESTELRSILESFAAKIAARKIKDETLAELVATQQAMEDAFGDGHAPDHDGVSEANNRFHALILEAAENSSLVSALKPLVQPIVILGKFTAFNEARVRQSFIHHREIIRALKARNPEWAESAMRTHFLAAKSYDKKADEK